MLKWLVTKSPSQIPVENSVTDDPLATLRRTINKHEPIYAVSRVNPIFEEDPKSTVEDTEAEKCIESEKCFPDSPPTDRESVRSSGYGSKETDSVSYKSEGLEEVQNPIGLTEKSENDSELSDIPKKVELNSPGTVADIRRSFEVLSNPELVLVTHNTASDKVVTTNPKFVHTIELITPAPSLQVIPEVLNESENESTPQKKSSWPRVSHLAQALQRQAERIHQRRERERFKEKLRNKNQSNYKHQILRFNPLVSVVAQDERYVTEISLSPHKKIKTQKDIKCHTDGNYVNDVNFQLGYHESVDRDSRWPINRFSQSMEESFQPDSLVTEDTFRMMNSPEYETNVKFNDKSLTLSENEPQADLPNFGKAIYSNFYPTLNYSRSSSHYSLERKEGQNRTLGRAKLNGVNAVKDLWEKSGLKTNGRKLLVNATSQMNDQSFVHYKESENRLNEMSENKLKYPLKKVKNNDSEDVYENVPSLGRASSSFYSVAGNSYEYIRDPEKGIDNLGYVHDIGYSTESLASSNHSKHSYPFQYNLTDFQRRVSDKLQAEGDERNSTLGKTTVDSDRGQTNSKSLKKNKKNYPGRAVKELGLASNSWRQMGRKEPSDDYSMSPSGPSHLNEASKDSGSLGQKNRVQIWEQFYGRHKDDTFPAYFFRHPNSEAPIFAHHDGFHHDFTLDAKRSQRILKRSSRSKRRRKCCIGFLVLFAFMAFIAAIIGLSWFSTGGERLFGPM